MNDNGENDEREERTSNPKQNDVTVYNLTHVRNFKIFLYVYVIVTIIIGVLIALLVGFLWKGPCECKLHVLNLDLG